jgi:hypothetical protein
MCTPRRWLFALLVALAGGLPSTAHAQAKGGITWGRLNTTRFPQERQKLRAQHGDFPRLGEAFEVLGTSTSRYNCIGWSLGITHYWVWPGDAPERFDALNSRYGFRRLGSLDTSLQPSMRKIVVYGKYSAGRWHVTHQARQLRDGTWTSKLGRMALIRHPRPESLAGPAYGRPIAVYIHRDSTGPSRASMAKLAEDAEEELQREIEEYLAAQDCVLEQCSP